MSADTQVFVSQDEKEISIRILQSCLIQTKDELLRIYDQYIRLNSPPQIKAIIKLWYAVYVSIFFNEIEF